MRYSLDRLCADVMARLGESVRPQPSVQPSGIPWPEDIISEKVKVSLAEAGSRLIREAPAECLAEGSQLEAEASLRLMPCGLYGAEVRLPEGFLRLVSVKMAGWRKSAVSAAGQASAGWMRQWSDESGIAGCPERPRSYFDSDRAGALLRLMGCSDASDRLEWLQGWVAPSIGDDGGFVFPEALYGALVDAMARKVNDE